jgi:hypothetical protein
MGKGRAEGITEGNGRGYGPRVLNEGKGGGYWPRVLTKGNADGSGKG